MLVLGGREDVDSVGSRGKGEDFSFGFVEMDTQRRTKVNKEGEEEGDVFIGEERASVVDERGGSGTGSKAIVSEIKGYAAILGALL
jgi:hypothetical protein